MTSQARTTVGVHVPINASFTPMLRDRRDTDFTDPYYELHIADITCYVTPAQLTELAASLQGYSYVED